MGMRFVLVPARRFIMESPSSESGRYDDEGPQHEEVRSRKESKILITRFISSGMQRLKKITVFSRRNLALDRRKTW